VCCNLKRGLYLGTKKKQKGGYIKGRREYLANLWLIVVRIDDVKLIQIKSELNIN